jgi:hypothetical protein
MTTSDGSGLPLSVAVGAALGLIFGRMLGQLTPGMALRSGSCRAPPPQCPAVALVLLA